jgi:predicted phage terminase large subunit-like protein
MFESSTGLYRPKRAKPLTRKQFDESVLYIRQMIETSVKPFSDNSQKARKKRKRECENDFEKFKQTYLPHYFTKPSGEIHQELHEYCSTGGKSINAVAYPREHGKSVNASFAELIHKAAYLKSRYSLIISDTLDLSKEFLVWIRIEFERNDRLKQDFGRKGVLKTEGWWEKDDIVITTAKGQARIRALGASQKVRGTRFMMWRPMYIVIDDLENNVNVKNKKLVKERVRWILGAVYASMDDSGTLIMIGTTLDKISVLTLIIEHIIEKGTKIEKQFGIKAMNAVVYSAIKEGNTPLWPEGKSLEKLLQIKEIVGEDVWLREFMNKPPDSGAFKLSWMKDFDREVVFFIPTKFIHFTGSDPSARENEANDYKAHVCVAKHPENNKIYTADAWIRPMATFTDFNIAYIDMFREYHPVQSGYETNGYQRVVKRELERLCREHNIMPNIREIEHYTDKLARIIRWQAMVEREDILFDKEYRDIEILILQLNSLGSREHDDGADAWEMAVDLAVNYGGDFEYESAGKRASTEMRSSIVDIGNRRFSASVKFDLFGM